MIRHSSGDVSFGHTLIVGAGPAGIHLAVDLSRGWSSRLGLLNRPGPHSDRMRLELERNGYAICTEVEAAAGKSLQGEVRLDRYYDGYEQVEDNWQTIVLCTPSDAYEAAVQALKLESRRVAERILLLSPGIGSNLLVQRLAGSSQSSIEVISFSTYYAASRLDPGNIRKSVVKGWKRKVVAASNRSDSLFLPAAKRFVHSLGIECELGSDPIEAESRSITMYVHPPFFLNEFSLNEIFSSEPSKKYMYKLYPEGPITPNAIRDMVALWKEINELVSRFRVKPLNLLKFLNDDNYPVREQSLSREDIERFMETDETKQQYLLYVRYASILIDPFSEPDASGKYYDFSAFPYPQIAASPEGKWNVPRIPYEDYRKLKLMLDLADRLNVDMPEASRYVRLFERKLEAFEEEKGSDLLQAVQADEHERTEQAEL